MNSDAFVILRCVGSVAEESPPFKPMVYGVPFVQSGDTVVPPSTAAFNTPNVPKLRLFAVTEQLGATLAVTSNVVLAVLVRRLQLTRESRPY